MPDHSSRRSGFLNLGQRYRRPSESGSTLQPLRSNPSSPTNHRILRSPSPAYSDPFSSQNGHSNVMDAPGHDILTPPTVPFRDRESRSALAGGSGLSSRRSSFSDKGSDSLGMPKTRPSSLSVNYVPAKFTKLHAPGDWAHRKAKQGGGRDAFARNASRMGMLGAVDDDEGVVFQLGRKGGLKRKKPKLRWNRFKFVLFAANTVVSRALDWIHG